MMNTLVLLLICIGAGVLLRCLLPIFLITLAVIFMGMASLGNFIKSLWSN